MGFLRRIFGGGGKKPANKSGEEPVKSKKRWSFIKSSKEKSSQTASRSVCELNQAEFSASPFLSYGDSLNANKHAIAVAAATAAVAEAALAAAHAAAEVVRLTNGAAVAGGCGPGSSQRRWPEDIAAVKIQSAFRGYLAKRALRALKALVKLQALVRGHIVRKQTSDMLRRMQTLVRLQSRARAGRVQLSHIPHSPNKSPLSLHPVSEHHESSFRTNSAKFEGSPLLKRCSSNANYRDIVSGRSRFGSQWYERWMEENVWNHPRGDDEKSDKILEVDTWKPNINSKSENRLAYESPSKSSTKSVNQSFFSSLKFQRRKGEKASRTAETIVEELSASYSYQNSPESFSASRRRTGPFTPTRSECGYFGHPNYMANTESSRAKARSVSAPRQRIWDFGNNSDRHADLKSQFTSSTSSRFNRVLSTHLR